MAVGWIKIHRQIQDHWLWAENSNRFKWWLDILINANYEPKDVIIGRQKIECGRGQSVRSLETWAQRWRTTKSTVTAFLKLLESCDMISTENMKVTTRITICNYDTYQELTNANDTADGTQIIPQTERRRNANDTQEKEDKKVKKDKKIRKEEIFYPPTLDEVKEYFEEKGYTAPAAEKAWNYYDIGKWKDSKGNQVKNWKQKMISVWFKPENKKSEPSGANVFTSHPSPKATESKLAQNLSSLEEAQRLTEIRYGGQ
jgi:hypothetical protein